MAFESMYYPKSLFCEHAHDIAFSRHDGWCAWAGMQSHFGLPGVYTYTFALAHHSIALCGTSFGCDVYRENQVTGGAGFEIIPDVRMAVGVSLLNFWVKDLSNCTGYAVHTSAYYDIGDIRIGGWLNNMNVPRFNSTDAIPMVYAIRAQYAIRKDLECIIAARGTHERLPFFNVGMSWEVHKHIIIGIGANTDPLYVEYMLRMPLGHIGIHYAGTLHEYLGLSHSMNLAFSL